MLATARITAKHLLLGISRPATVTVCIIGRDNEGTIAACLESIRRWVDQIVFVDTGSVDRTPLIAAAAGAEVYHFPWIDDFAAARNESLRHARGDWVFWMDTDDSIDGVNGAKLRALVLGPTAPDVVAYVLQVHCPHPTRDGGQEITIVDHVKLFRNLPELRFEGRIHEQILPSIRRHGGQVAWTDIFVVHSGADHSLAGRQRKLERDLRILQQDLQERPEHPFVLFNLGMTYADAGQHTEARAYLCRCLAVSQVGETHLRKAYAILLTSLTALRQYEEAERVGVAGRALFPEDAELLFRLALLAQAQEDHARAVDVYRQVLRAREARHFSSLDVGILSYKTRHNLAVALSAQGRLDLAEVQWRTILAERPVYRPAWCALGQSLLSRGRWATLEVLLERAERMPELAGDALVLRGRWHWARGEREQAHRKFKDAVLSCPDSYEAWQALSHFLFVADQPEAAAAALRHLVQLQPTDGASWHNLGVVQLQTGQLPAARASFAESLRYRPDAAHTRLCLAEIESRLGDAVSPTDQPRDLAS